MSLAEATPTAAEHAASMAAYIVEGEVRARNLGNRGPIRLDANGKLAVDILESYWENGFYVFEGVFGADERGELCADVEAMLAEAPAAPENPDGAREAHGAEGSRYRFRRPSYRYARPLSDPVGGTAFNKGRHPVKMVDPVPDGETPGWTVERLIGNLQAMESCLRLHGHPGLLAVAEAVCGADFVPYTEVTFVKQPGLGPSVAWHRDGTTHWDAEDWDAGAHGFNFMAQLYKSTPANGVWFLPGSHRARRLDIRSLVAESGSERLDDAVPLVAGPGDVCIANRQCVHGSFANSSPDLRVTLNAGFFPRMRVEGVSTTRLDGTAETYDGDRIHRRACIVGLAIDARAQRFPDETRYVYRPLVGREDENRWNAETRESLLRDYNIYDMYI